MRRLVLPLVAIGLALAAGSARAESGGFTTFDNPSGGRLIAGALPAADSTTKAALIDMLRRTHRYFGARPQVDKVVVTPGGATALAFFAETTSSGPVLGLVIAGKRPGQPAQGALLFDQAGRFQTTIKPLMQHLAASGAPAGAAPPATPALPLTRQQFSDGSGSVGVPAGWKMVSWRKGRFAVLFRSQQTPMGLAEGASYLVDLPGGQMARTYQWAKAHHLPGPAPIIAPLSQDPVRDIFNVMRGGPGMSGIRLLRVLVTRRLPTSPSPFPVARWFVVFDFVNAKGVAMRLATIADIPRQPMALGSWILNQELDVRAPVSLWAQFMPTGLAIQRSVKLNMAVIAQEYKISLQQSQAMMEANHKAFMASMQSQFAAHQAANQAMTNATHAAARAFIRTIQGTSVFRNVGTGVHRVGPSGFVHALTQADPQHYQPVPLRSYLPGVDY
ncbi:MAG: hypothetical protein ACP5NI_10225 [Acetobacteraceae bacterium]